jgi:hypothetical protein
MELKEIRDILEGVGRDVSRMTTGNLSHKKANILGVVNHLVGEIKKHETSGLTISESLIFYAPVSLERSISPTLELLSELTKNEMDITIENGHGFVEWDIPELEITECIGLWFDGNKLTDYDGVFELPEELIRFLKDKGFDLEDIE